MYFDETPSYMLIKKDGYFVLFNGDITFENFEKFLDNNIVGLKKK